MSFYVVFVGCKSVAIVTQDERETVIDALSEKHLNGETISSTMVDHFYEAALMCERCLTGEE
jgi:hypothetical protein